MPKPSEQMISRLSSNVIVANLLEKMDSSNQNRNTEDTRTTSYHCIETAGFVAETAQFLDIKQGELLDAVVLGALIHDTGKSGVAIEELHRPGKLTDKEKQFLLDHPLNGATIIRREVDQDNNEKNIFSFAPDQWDLAIAIVALHHTIKAKKDSCYPTPDALKQLVDNNILNPEALQIAAIDGYAKLVAICDVYSAVSANRPYAYKTYEQTNIEAIVKDELGLNSVTDLNIIHHLSQLISKR